MRRRDLITAIGLVALPGCAGLTSARESNGGTDRATPATASEADHPERRRRYRGGAHLRPFADGAYTAVVDRFEGAIAVLLLEEHGDTVGEISLSEWRLPPAARHADAVLTVRVDNGVVVGTTYEERVTAERAERAQSRFDSLSRRPPPSDDGDSASDSESESGEDQQ